MYELIWMYVCIYIWEKWNKIWRYVSVEIRKNKNKTQGIERMILFIVELLANVKHSGFHVKTSSRQLKCDVSSELYLILFFKTQQWMYKVAVVEGDLKASFSIATTPRWRGG